MDVLIILIDITAQGTEVAAAAAGASGDLLAGMGIGGGVGGGGGIAYVRWQLKQQAEATANAVAAFAKHQAHHVELEDVQELKAAVIRHAEKHERDDREIFNFISAASAKMASIDDFMQRIEKKL